MNQEQKIALVKAKVLTGLNGLRMGSTSLDETKEEIINLLCEMLNQIDCQDLSDIIKDTLFVVWERECNT